MFKLKAVLIFIMVGLFALPVWAGGGSFGLAIYAGQFYDSTPIKALTGFRDSQFEDHYMFGLAVNREIWASANWPVSVELEGVMAQQFGKADLTELAVAPVLKWQPFASSSLLSGVQVRFAPVGVSWLSKPSPMEPQDKQNGRFLNYLVAELAVSTANKQLSESEIFVRLHHRCTVFELWGDNVKNGEDFLAVGYRHYF
ncbi:MAG: hypothetical protein CR991_04390 [Proteobacteria bacterium]|nr:MAG: hypothetical protein CR991_04390 [Pseudomonadota bacterium]